MPNCLLSLIATLDCQIVACNIVTSTKTKDLLQLTLLFFLTRMYNEVVTVVLLKVHFSVVRQSIEFSVSITFPYSITSQISCNDVYRGVVQK